MMKFATAVPTTLMAALFATNVQAGLLNGGFETGDFTGWTTNNGLSKVVSSKVVSTAGTPSGPTAFTTMTPTEGKFFALLPAGNKATTIFSDAFDVKVGDKISFDWFFSAEDFKPWNDFASYSLELLVANTIISADILSMVDTVGNYGLTGWNKFSYVSPLDGDMSLKFWSVNTKDNKLNSLLGVDNVSVTAVPEPSALVILGLGFLAFGISRKKSMVSVN